MQDISYGALNSQVAAPICTHFIIGSAQEFDGTRILGCFPESDEFGLEGRHPLRLQ